MTLNKSFCCLWTNQKLNSYFADFEQAKIILLTLNKSKKLPREKPDAYALFLFRPLPHVTSTPPWLLRSMRVSTSSELYPDTWLFFVFECIGIQFFNSHTCDLRDAMLRQRSPTLIPRKAEDFPRGDRHFKRVPPPTYLIHLSPKGLYW